MLLGPTWLAQSALAWVCTTAFGREVVPDVNMMPTGAIGSAGRSGQSASSPKSDVERVEAVGGLLGGRGRAAVVVGDHDPLQRGAGLGDHRRELRLGDRGDGSVCSTK